MPPGTHTLWPWGWRGEADATSMDTPADTTVLDTEADATALDTEAHTTD